MGSRQIAHSRGSSSAEPDLPGDAAVSSGSGAKECKGFSPLRTRTGYSRGYLHQEHAAIVPAFEFTENVNLGTLGVPGSRPCLTASLSGSFPGFVE